MSDLAVGVQLLEYMDQVNTIVTTLAGAAESAHVAAGLLAGEDGFYDGRARAEMKLFYEAWAAQVDKLMGFQSVAAQFLKTAFDEFGANEEDLNRIILAWLAAT
jgi:hypothetical protein